MPAEWEPHGLVMLAWPHADTDWNYMLTEVDECYIELARAISRDADLLIVSEDDGLAGRLRKAGVTCRVHVANVPTDDTWTRDYGPLTVEVGGVTRLVDFKFNGWGLKFAASRDNLVNRAVFGPYGCALENRLSFVLEGGSVESDGRGTILTTSRCLLSPNRNGGLSRGQICERLRRYLGAERVLWLDHGALAGDDTDSHVDTLCRLAPEDTIVYTGCNDPSDEHYAGLKAMREQLSTFVTAGGNPFNLVELPLPDAIFDSATGERLPATYANYLVLEHSVVMPVYGQIEKDRHAAGILRSVFPDREIRTVDCRALIRQHGSLHCATMQLPSRLLL